ncbi:GtrA family protein [Mumia zhuanghuii]|uniref:GtrA family protein n=1 Tax=Mumia zhuanghuii TaxID=2585211 RepID=UPI003644A29D
MDLSRVLDDLRRTRLGMVAGVATAGGFGWLVDTAVLWGLGRGLGVAIPLAAVFGFATGGVVNFFMNRAVFRGGGAPTDTGEIIRYMALFGANTVAVALLVPAFAAALEHLLGDSGAALLGGKLITTLVLLPLNALAYRRWVFASRERSTPVA